MRLTLMVLYMGRVSFWKIANAEWCGYARGEKRLHSSASPVFDLGNQITEAYRIKEGLGWLCE
jgi:hypothetical protein